MLIWRNGADCLICVQNSDGTCSGVFDKRKTFRNSMRFLWHIWQFQHKMQSVPFTIPTKLSIRIHMDNIWVVLNVRNLTSCTTVSIPRTLLHVINCEFDVWFTVHLNSVKITKPTRCHFVLYFISLYKLLNMFQAIPCPSSGADDWVVW